MAVTFADGIYGATTNDPILFPKGFIGGGGINIVGSTGVNQTFNGASKPTQVITPTANIDVTLVNTTNAIFAGQDFTIINAAAVGTGGTAGFIITIKSSDGDIVRRVYPQTSGTVLALQDSPTDRLHWKGIGIVKSEWEQYSFTITADSVNPTAGTLAENKAFWRREGSNIHETLNWRQTGAGSAGTGNYLFPHANGYMTDTSRMGAIPGQTSMVLGIAGVTSGASLFYGSVRASDSSAGHFMIDFVSGGAVTTAGSGTSPLSNATSKFSFNATTPIVGWQEEGDSV